LRAALTTLFKRIRAALSNNGFVFGHNRKRKNKARYGYFRTSLFLYTNIFCLRLKTCGFLLFYYFSFPILVSSLSVPLYASRSSADDFCSKSVRH
jgi:hypothetical protein